MKPAFSFSSDFEEPSFTDTFLNQQRPESRLHPIRNSPLNSDDVNSSTVTTIAPNKSYSVSQVKSDGFLFFNFSQPSPTKPCDGVEFSNNDSPFSMSSLFTDKMAVSSSDIESHESFFPVRGVNTSFDPIVSSLSETFPLSYNTATLLSDDPRSIINDNFSLFRECALPNNISPLRNATSTSSTSSSIRDRSDSQAPIEKKTCSDRELVGSFQITSSVSSNQTLANSSDSKSIASVSPISDSISSISFSDAKSRSRRSSKHPKQRLIWTRELHTKFVEACEKLEEKAVPKSILFEMNVGGLTRENVASHLQKYRMQRKEKRSSSDFDEIFEEEMIEDQISRSSSDDELSADDVEYPEPSMYATQRSLSNNSCPLSESQPEQHLQLNHTYLQQQQLSQDQILLRDQVSHPHLHYRHSFPPLSPSPSSALENSKLVDINNSQSGAFAFSRMNIAFDSGDMHPFYEDTSDYQLLKDDDDGGIGGGGSGCGESARVSGSSSLEYTAMEDFNRQISPTSNLPSAPSSQNGSPSTRARKTKQSSTKIPVPKRKGSGSQLEKKSQKVINKSTITMRSAESLDLGKFSIRSPSEDGKHSLITTSDEIQNNNKPPSDMGTTSSQDAAVSLKPKKLSSKPRPQSKKQLLLQQQQQLKQEQMQDQQQKQEMDVLCQQSQNYPVPFYQIQSHMYLHQKEFDHSCIDKDQRSQLGISPPDLSQARQHIQDIPQNLKKNRSNSFSLYQTQQGTSLSSDIDSLGNPSSSNQNQGTVQSHLMTYSHSPMIDSNSQQLLQSLLKPPQTLQVQDMSLNKAHSQQQPQCHQQQSEFLSPRSTRAFSLSGVNTSDSSVSFQSLLKSSIEELPKAPGLAFPGSNKISKKRNRSNSMSQVSQEKPGFASGRQKKNESSEQKKIKKKGAPVGQKETSQSEVNSYVQPVLQQSVVSQSLPTGNQNVQSSVVYQPLATHASLQHSFQQQPSIHLQTTQSMAPSQIFFQQQQQQQQHQHQHQSQFFGNQPFYQTQPINSPDIHPPRLKTNNFELTRQSFFANAQPSKSVNDSQFVGTAPVVSTVDEQTFSQQMAGLRFLRPREISLQTQPLDNQGTVMRNPPFLFAKGMDVQEEGGGKRIFPPPPSLQQTAHLPNGFADAGGDASFSLHSTNFGHGNGPLLLCNSGMVGAAMMIEDGVSPANTISTSSAAPYMPSTFDHMSCTTGDTKFYAPSGRGMSQEGNSGTGSYFPNGCGTDPRAYQMAMMQSISAQMDGVTQPTGSYTNQPLPLPSQQMPQRSAMHFPHDVNRGPLFLPRQNGSNDGYTPVLMTSGASQKAGIDFHSDGALSIHQIDNNATLANASRGWSIEKMNQ